MSVDAERVDLLAANVTHLLMGFREHSINNKSNPPLFRFFLVANSAHVSWKVSTKVVAMAIAGAFAVGALVIAAVAVAFTTGTATAAADTAGAVATAGAVGDVSAAGTAAATGFSAVGCVLR